MDYYMNSTGSASLCIKEFEVQTDCDLKKGTVLVISDGKATVATGSATEILGVLAEDYKVECDEFNHRNGSGYVRVIVSPGAIYREDAIEVTLTEAGTATSITVAGLTMPSAQNAFKGGCVKLVSKTAASTNSDEVGSIRAITASNGAALTLKNGGKACIGDVYAILPPASFSYLALEEGAAGYTFGAEKSNTVRLTRCDKALGIYELSFKSTLYN